jgi:hypothetical protein
MQSPLPPRRRVRRRSVSALLVAAIALTMVPPPVSAAGVVPVFNPLESATIGAISVTPRGKITEEQIDRPIGTIPHSDFAVLDPVTKKAVDRTAIITAPSGQKVKAGDYTDGLNAVEIDLNKHGQTLRGTSTLFELGTLNGGHAADFAATVKRSPATAGRYTATSGSDRAHPTIVQDAVTLPETLPDTVTNTAPTAPPNTGANNPALIKLVPYAPYGFKDLGWAPITAPPGPAPPGKITLTKSYSETEGNKSLAAIALNTSATAEGGTGNVGHVILDESLSAYLFGAGGSIMTATADANPKTATIDMSAIGDSIVSYNGPAIGGPAGLKSLDLFDVSISISVSVFTVTLAASANAAFFATSMLIPHDSYINATIAPYAALNGSFSASFGVGDTSGSYGFGIAVGVEGDLTIASIVMPLSASAGMPMTMLRSGTAKTNRNIYACFLTFDGSINSEADYTFLSGSLSVFLKGCIIFCATIFKLHIVSWGGITGKDTFFHEQERKLATDAYSDLAQYGVSDPGTAFSKDDASGMPQACDDLQKSQHQYGSFGS